MNNNIYIFCKINLLINKFNEYKRRDQQVHSQK